MGSIEFTNIEGKRCTKTSTNGKWLASAGLQIISNSDQDFSLFLEPDYGTTFGDRSIEHTNETVLANGASVRLRDSKIMIDDGEFGSACLGFENYVIETSELRQLLKDVILQENPQLPKGVELISKVDEYMDL